MLRAKHTYISYQDKVITIFHVFEVMQNTRILAIQTKSQNVSKMLPPITASRSWVGIPPNTIQDCTGVEAMRVLRRNSPTTGRPSVAEPPHNPNTCCVGFAWRFLFLFGSQRSWAQFALQTFYMHKTPLVQNTRILGIQTESFFPNFCPPLQNTRILAIQT